MAPISFTEKKSLGTDGLIASKDAKSSKTRGAVIPFVLTTLLVLGYYLATPILSACSHRHSKLTVEERAAKILLENPLIGWCLNKLVLTVH